jgi:ARG and Rhodanese-Phosphatase-superfamily-associated Protein domain
MHLKRLIAISAITAAATWSSYAPAQQQATVNQGPSTPQVQTRIRAQREPVKSGKAAELERIAGKLKIIPSEKHENLEIYLLEGDDRIDTSSVLTLDEALEKKGVVRVKETQEVNELTVSNKHTKSTVFIMAGDIVKGGQQDRTLGTDLPLAAKSREIPVTAFCVEQGRWSARKGESVQEFGSSKNAIVGKEGKLAVRSRKDQSAVWESVAKSQSKLNANLSTSVSAPVSPSSLQLALENPKVQSSTKEYTAAFRDMAEKHPKSIGFVAVINGEINNGEIFAGHDLFRRVWPKLLDACATEAISEKDQKRSGKEVTAETVNEFLAKAEDAKATSEKIHGTLANVFAETGQTALFQTVDKARNDLWLRRSIIKK